MFPHDDLHGPAPAAVASQFARNKSKEITLEIRLRLCAGVLQR